jgi:hypothetical protein
LEQQLFNRKILNYVNIFCAALQASDPQQAKVMADVKTFEQHQVYGLLLSKYHSKPK